MIGHAVSAKSEALEVHELSSEDLDTVSGGFFFCFIPLVSKGGTSGGNATGGGQNDPAQMFQQIMNQLTSG
jgi:hypothetical protein